LSDRQSVGRLVLVSIQQFEYNVVLYI